MRIIDAHTRTSRAHAGVNDECGYLERTLTTPAVDGVVRRARPWGEGNQGTRRLWSISPERRSTSRSPTGRRAAGATAPGYRARQVVAGKPIECTEYSPDRFFAKVHRPSGDLTQHPRPEGSLAGVRYAPFWRRADRGARAGSADRCELGSHPQAVSVAPFAVPRVRGRSRPPRAPGRVDAPSRS